MDNLYSNSQKCGSKTNRLDQQSENYYEYQFNFRNYNAYKNENSLNTNNSPREAINQNLYNIFIEKKN